MKNIKQIKQEQKEVLLKAIADLEKDYKKWCAQFIKKLAPDTRKNCKDVIEEQLRYEWDTVYEPQDRQLQLALIHFERYEKEYVFLEVGK